VFVREQLLCNPLPAPPPNVGEPPEPEPGMSTRERFELHSSETACAGCHQLIDPLGFAFENYDGIGRYRTMEEGQLIDAEGALVSTDVDGPFSGVPGLAQKLSESEQVKLCATRQWFRYTLQRFEQEADGCSMQALVDDFAASNHRFSSLRPAIVQTPAFRMRRPIDTEGGTL
jgi:hypothetical protein